MTRRCIISYATYGREPYPLGIPRLIKSGLDNKHGYSSDSSFLIYSPDALDDSYHGVSINKKFPPYSPVPSHGDIPYGFKPYIFQIAFNLGFHQVLWCDSTIVIHKPLDPVWQIAEERGLFVAANPGCPICVWTSDDALDKMGCPRDCNLDEIQACAMAIDIRNPKAKAIFTEWMMLCNDGITFAGRGRSTRPDFRDHRHDQSAMSWLTHRESVIHEPYGMLCYHNDIPKFPQNVLANTGLGQI